MKAQNDEHKDKIMSLLLSAVDHGAKEPDRQFLDKLKEQSTAEFSTFSTDGNKQSEKTIPISIWRIIMKSRITQIAAAAAIIILVTVGFCYYTGSFHGTTAVFAASDVIDAMKKVQWIHATQQMIDTNNVPAEKIEYWNGGEYWQSIDPYRTILIRQSGDIEFTDLNSKKVYDPKNKTITVTFRGRPEKDPPANIEEVWMEGILGLETIGAKVEYSDSVYEGRPAKVIKADYTSESGWHEEVTLIAEAETRLARKFMIYQKTTKGVSGTILMLIDYPSTGPKDIYEAGAPRDAEVKEIDKEK